MPAKEDEERCAICWGQVAVPPEWPEEEVDEEKPLIERSES
jgi:hypothetical protein